MICVFLSLRWVLVFGVARHCSHHDRVFSLAFWSQAFAELKARSGSSFVGVVVLAVESAAVVLAVELLAASSPKSGRKKD